MPSGVTGTCRPSSIFSASSRAVISSRPLPVTIRRSQPARVLGGLGEARAQVERALDHARAGRLVGGAGDRGEGQQRRDVADGVAPRACRPAAWRSTRSAPVSASGLAVIRIVRAFVARHRGERGRRAGLVGDGDQHALVLRVQRGLEGVAGAGAEQRRAGHRGVLARAAARDDDRLGLAHPLGGLERLGEARIGATRPGSAQDHLFHRPRRAIAQLGHRRSWLSTVPSQWTFRQSHFDADEPSHFGAVRHARPRRARAAARPARGRDLRRDHRRRRAARHPPARLAHARRGAPRLPRRGQRGLRPDRRRRLDRDPPRSAPVVRAVPPPHATAA